jgi:hypothetical protein
MEKLSYLVLLKVRHDETDYEAGSSIDLSADEAAPLLAVKAIAPTTPADLEPEPKKTTRKTKEAE